MRTALAALVLAAMSIPAAADPVPAPAPSAEEAHDGCHWRAGWHHHHTPGRFALGFAHGRLGVEDGDDVGVRSLLARVAVHRGLEVELELSRFAVADDDAHAAGVALIHAFGRHRLRPYVVAGAGGGRIARDAGDASLRYAELGGGLVLRGHRLAIGVDVRRGVRRGALVDDPTATARMTTAAGDDHERYVRGRVLALVYF